MSYAGIATATGTRLDSASKHTMACKLDDTLHVDWHGEQCNARVNIQNNKYRFAMLKDELALNVTQKLNNASRIRTGAKAYPSVVTSLGMMPWPVKRALARLYSAATGPEFLHLRVAANVIHAIDINDEDTAVVTRMWNTMPFFTAQGYALGTAWASAHSGDTVGTVLVGGMLTVRNGAFACRTGQPVMFYFDFEEEHFSHKQGSINNVAVYEGERITVAEDYSNEAAVIKRIEAKKQPDANAAGRKRARSLEYDQYQPDTAGKSGIALPKPYIMKQGEHHYGDRIRVFAKCINGGRAYDMIDLMLMTQSL